MITFRMNGLNVQAEEGWTVLEAARFYGIEIPTLCYMDSLTAYGGCRLCVVEIGEGKRAQLVSSCTYKVEEGLNVRTDTKRAVAARRMMIELMISMAPKSKVLQDLASQFGVTKVRFEPRNEECILCGRCVRMCEEQMDAKAIGFQQRGYKKKIATPFDLKSAECRTCGGCLYVCPVCQLRCQGPDAETTLCNACLTMAPTCLDHYEELQCWMYDAGRCGSCVQEKKA